MPIAAKEVVSRREVGDRAGGAFCGASPAMVVETAPQLAELENASSNAHIDLRCEWSNVSPAAVPAPGRAASVAGQSQVRRQVCYLEQASQEWR